jgi:Lon protease-like protein
VPVFPLPNVFLFPGCLMPLHIFEQRYRDMIEDLLDRPGRLVMGTILEGEAKHSCAPAMHDVGGLGEIGHHERLPDGRFLIWLIGIARVRIREVPSDRAYRRVEIEMLEEVDAPRDREPELRARVRTALLARCAEIAKLPAEPPLTQWVDMLLQKLHLPQSTMQDLYSEMHVARRADGALREHARRPIPPPTTQV